MLVIGVDEFGPPEVLRPFEVADPDVGSGEIRVRVRAAAVNPTDTLTRSGGRAEALRAGGPPPYVPGMDIAGVVDRVGPDVATGVAVGDEVMAIVRPMGGYGGYSELVVVPAASAVAVPAGASMAEAASVPMNGLTARRALDLVDLSPGATVFVSGAAGAFGGAAVQLAKADGLTVIADASDADRTLVQGLGADHVVSRGDDVADAVLALVPDGVDAVLDGSVQGSLLHRAIRDGGAYAGVRGADGEFDRGIVAHAVWVRDYVTAHDKLEQLRQMVEAGTLSMRVAQVFPATDAPTAHRILEAGGTRGRLILEF